MILLGSLIDGLFSGDPVDLFGVIGVLLDAGLIVVALVTALVLIVGGPRFVDESHGPTDPDGSE